METYLERLIKLSDDEEKSPLTLEIRTLSTKFDSYFSIVVLGDVSRGKSTLINRLIDEDILPVGDIPTTKVVTKILHGQQERLTIVTEENDTEVLPIDSITEDAWQKPNAKQHILELANENMHVTNVAFFDTPALDLSNNKGSLYFEEISSITKTVDAVILVLTVQSPLSLSNLEFLRDHVRKNHVPRLLVVLNHLDQATSGQVQLLSGIHAKLNSIDLPYTFVGLTQNPQEATREFLDGSTYSDIWKVILNWTRDEAHNKLRQRQKLRQVELLALQLKDSIDLQLKEVEKKEKENERLINAEYNSIQDKDATWNSIELKFEERLRSQQHFVEQRISAYTPRLMDLMHYSLGQTEDIKRWYEVDLPFILKGQLETLRENVSRPLQKRIEGDFRLIEQEVNKLINEEYQFAKDSDNAVDGLSGPNLPFIEESLLKNHKRVTMKAITIATVVGYFVFGPLGAAISAGGGLLTDLFTKKSIQEQKETLINRLDQTFKKQLHLLTISIGEQLDELYRSNINDLHKQAMAWKENELGQLESRRLSEAAIPDKLSHKRKQILSLLEDINFAQSSIYGNK